HKGKTVKTLELLSSNGLSQIINVPESTVSSWTDEFQMFIPKAKKQDKLYYLPEAVDVLLLIKQYDDENYSKTDIMKMLADRVFPKKENNMDEHKQQPEKKKKGTHKENLVTMMQTIGKTVANVASQEKLLQMLQEQQSKHNRRIKIMEKQAEEIDSLKVEMQQIRSE